VAAAGGLWLWFVRAELAAQRFALLLGVLVLAQLFYDPRVTPAPLWGIRRFLPVAIPTLLIAAALTCAALARFRRWLPIAALLLLIAATGGRNALTFRGAVFRNASDDLASLGALIPDNAIVAYDPELALDSQLHIALWATRGLPAYLFDADMRKPLRRLQAAFPDRPIYWIGGGSDPARGRLSQIADPVASYRFNVGSRRLDWYDRRDDVLLRSLTLWLYRLRPPAEPALH
jgi:hypothetical protein